MKPKLTCSTLTNLSSISPDAWNQLTDPDFPFLDYEWLKSLEETGCVGGETGWHPFYITIWDKTRLIGALVVYEKHQSRGEFLYDWQWEAAYDRSGAPYYPKGIVVAPFTPATGNRLMAATPDVREQLLAELDQLSEHRGWQSVHFGFTTAQDRIHIGATPRWIQRQLLQYHWTNKGYQTFDCFLEKLKSNRRKQVKKERRRVSSYGLSVQIKSGDDLTPTDVSALAAFYFSTHDKNWGTPFLTEKFFQHVAKSMANRVVCVLAYDPSGAPVAGTFNLTKGQKLYGRYWGTIKPYPDLHFECCYYQLIEYAIQNQLHTIEAGAQGEHKFFRGFDATPVWFAHEFKWQNAHLAICDYVQQAHQQIKAELDAYNDASAYRNDS